MVTETAADDHGRTEPTQAQWQMFEQQVQRILANMGGAEVQHNVHVQGQLSKTDRQVDVLIRQGVTGHEVMIVCECKRYNKHVGIGMVDEMVGKVLDIGASAGIMYAFSGYSANAKARANGAHNPKIDLRELPAEAERDYSELLRHIKFGDCANPNCATGDVDWELWPGPEGDTPVRAGFCNTCGTLTVMCNDEDCSALTAIVNEVQQCDNCEALYQIMSDHKGTFESVARLS